VWDGVPMFLRRALAQTVLLGGMGRQASCRAARVVSAGHVRHAVALGGAYSPRGRGRGAGVRGGQRILGGLSRGGDLDGCSGWDSLSTV